MSEVYKGVMGAALGSTIAFYGGLALYATCTLVFFLEMLRSGRLQQKTARHLGPVLLGLGALSHTGYLLFASVLTHVCPIKSVHFSLSIAILAAAAAYLIARLWWPIDLVGAFVAPLGLTLLLGTRLSGLSHEVAHFSPAFLTLHVAANLVGDALFLLACVSAGLYLFTEKRLKQKRVVSLLGRLPSLDTLDQAEHWFLLAGFPLLTLGIVTGAAWAHRLETGSVGEVLRSLFALLSWAIFAAVLLLRSAAGWRGRRAALGTIAGFVFAVVVLSFYLIRTTPGQPS